MAAKRKPTRKKAPAKRPKLVPRKQPETLRLRGATPSLTVNDLPKSLAWYRDVLGFVVGDLWKDGGKLLGAELRTGTVTFSATDTVTPSRPSETDAENPSGPT